MMIKSILVAVCAVISLTATAMVQDDKDEKIEKAVRINALVKEKENLQEKIAELTAKRNPDVIDQELDYNYMELKSRLCEVELELNELRPNKTEGELIKVYKKMATQKN